MRNAFFLIVLVVAIGMATTAIWAQSASGSHEYGPFFCKAYCSVLRVDPGNGTTLGDTNLQHLLDEKSAEYSMTSGDTIVVCNGFNCAEYRKTDSNDFLRISVQKEMQTPPNSPEPPGDSTTPPPMGGGSNIPISYWPSPSGSCVQATVEGPTGSTTEVYCG